MPFRLTKMLGTFMYLMNEVLTKFLKKFVIVYLDDILIFRKTLGENLLHICSVLERLREEKLLINLKKCSFAKKELVYLGFVVSLEGLKNGSKESKIHLGMAYSKIYYQDEIISWSG